MSPDQTDQQPEEQTGSPAGDEQDAALKSRHRAMWALGDYPTVAEEMIPGLGARVVEAARVGPGDRVLDVAAGSGNAALPAAGTGAEVVASDLTPELLEAGAARAREAGLEIAWRAADAEALPFEDASFDVVLSCVGVMFAPHHQAAADELVRVCRPGGRIALLSWTPTGFLGRLLATMRPYVAPPPPGVSPPPLWGDETHLRGLLGERVSEVSATREQVTVDRFASGEEWRDYFKTKYGPTVAAYRGLGDDTGRVQALDDELAALATESGAGSPQGMSWEYLLFTAHRA